MATAVGVAVPNESFEEEEEEEDEERRDGAVIRVFCTHSEPSYRSPWQRGQQYASTSSGFVIEPEPGVFRVMTVASRRSPHSPLASRQSPPTDHHPPTTTLPATRTPTRSSMAW